jgi:hypothetical protein
MVFQREEFDELYKDLAVEIAFRRSESVRDRLRHR